MRRAAIAAAAVLALAVASVGAVRGASLGAELYIRGQSLVIEDIPQPVQIGVINQGGIPIAGTLTVRGDGYALASESLGTVDPGKTGTVDLQATGPGPATITAHLLPVGAVPAGQQPVGLDLSLSIRHRTALEQVVHDVAPFWPIVALVIAIVVLTLRVIRPWEFRIRRRDRRYLKK